MSQNFLPIHGLAISTSNIPSPRIIVCSTDSQAESVYRQIKFFSSDDIDAYYLPDTETLPYDIDSPHPDIISRRAKVFGRLARHSLSLTLVVSVATLMRRIADKEHWSKRVILRVGDQLDESAIREALIRMGYSEQEIELAEPGDFIFKKQVLDIFTSGQGMACRVKSDEQGIVTSLQRIDLTSQRSIDAIEEVEAYPAREFSVADEALHSFKGEYLKRFELGHHDTLYKSVVKESIFPSGIEYFLPLFGRTSTLLDYLKSAPNIPSLIFLPGASEKISDSWSAIQMRYDDLSRDKSRRLVEPRELWLSEGDIQKHFDKGKLRIIGEKEYAELAGEDTSRNNIHRQMNLQSTVDHIEPKIRAADKTLICLFSNERVHQVELLCELMAVDPNAVATWEDFLETDAWFNVTIANIDDGFHLKSQNYLVISERELFGQPIFAKDEDLQEKGKTFEQINDLQHLSIGDPVVHVEYGVGRFLGLEKMALNARVQEFITIQYAEDAKAYVNMDDLHLVSRYGGLAMSDETPLDIMGSSRWRSNLETAAGEIRETARALILIEQERSTQEGIVMSKPGTRYHRFAQDFPFQETKDQRSAIQDVIADLMSPRPMDRTIVGDVGFGKTEVAMRAAFVTVDSGYQAAVMVPTTLLAQQHYESFKSRFEAHGKRVVLLTRFDQDEEAETLRGIRNGDVDVVIGTHRVVQPDVIFNAPGLLIVDEEHRFGVNQKSQLAEMRANLNVLSMTATPIPRTLGIALQGVRDLSIITTAPSKRLSIRTFVEQASERGISDAIEREMMRGGQVFYLHNKTEELEERARYLQTLAPKARIRYAHGQMREDQLTSIMRAFYDNEFDILVCTTIIEIGIDIPNANTILIERANNFGLAQLHQLRGRVGRSHHQGYAYLLVDDMDEISASARKRLCAVQQASRLGDGFLIANHDLEIRGAGELLGEEQSGHIKNIGFALYMRLLNNALEMLKRGMLPSDVTDFGVDLDVEIGLSGIIDNLYIRSDRMRLSLYKRFSSLHKVNEMHAIEQEMEDRFGPVPDNTRNLLLLSQVRCMLREVGVKKVHADSNGLVMEVRENPMIRLDRMIDMVNEGAPSLRLIAPTKFRLNMELPEVNGRIRVIKSLVDEFRAETPTDILAP